MRYEWMLFFQSNIESVIDSELFSIVNSVVQIFLISLTTNKKAAMLLGKSMAALAEKHGSFYSVVMVSCFPCFRRSWEMNQPSIFLPP